jgi:hypothetical protein
VARLFYDSEIANDFPRARGGFVGKSPFGFITDFTTAVGIDYVGFLTSDAALAAALPALILLLIFSSWDRPPAAPLSALPSFRKS